MGGARSTYGVGGCIQGFGGEREKGHLKDKCEDEVIILSWIFRKCNVVVLSESIGLRIGTSGEHL